MAVVNQNEFNELKIYISERLKTEREILLLKLSINSTVPHIPCAYYQIDTNVLVVYILINPYA